MSKQPLQNIVSVLIKDKDITSYQFLLTLVIVLTKSAPASILSVKGIKFL